MKVLVIRFSSMGDIVMTSPVVRWLKLQVKAEVHFITKEAYSDLVSANPYIDKLWTIDQNMDEKIGRLKQAKFNFVVDLHRSIRSRSLCFQLKLPVYRFDKLVFEKWAYLLLGVDLLKKQHIIERYLAGVRPLGIKNDHQGLDFFISGDNHVALRSDERPKIAIVMGGTFITKQLPVFLVDSLIRDDSRQYFILGGEDVSDRPITRDSHIHDYRGRCNVQQSASIIQQCDVVVSGDTGLTHIAAALKKKVVLIWGSTGPVFGMYPWYPGDLNHYEHSIRVPGLSCQPCSKYGKASCPKGHMKCLNDIDPRVVRQAVERHLS